MKRPIELLEGKNAFQAFLLYAIASTITGWALSGLHALSVFGYLVTLPIALVALAWILRPCYSTRISEIAFYRMAILRKRFRKPLPALYFLTTIIIFIGGILYSPNNYDALTYRLPRMLNWIAEKQFHWIPTANDRMNVSGTGWEWIAMPLFILRSDRGLFLINAVGYLLMPGLLFSIFRKVGIAGRVAWVWMWILPLGYGYATQAGGIGNDLTGTIFCLMSVYMGLRARTSKRVEDVWLCGLAAAITTGIKTSNLPLMLPCLVAVWPAMKLLRQRWVTGILMLGIGFLISAGPIALINQLHTGSWTGDPQNRYHVQIKNPAAGLVGNGILLIQQSFFPPVLPGAHSIDQQFNNHLPTSLKEMLGRDFERYRLSRLNELPQEEGAGLGLGVSALLILGTVASALAGNFIRSRRRWSQPYFIIGFSAWISCSVYMAKMGSESTARLMLPYYPLAILPLLGVQCPRSVIRFKLWLWLAGLCGAFVLPALLFSPARPVWPAQSVCDKLAEQFSSTRLARRMSLVYSSYRNRNDIFAPIKARIPEDVVNIGFFGGSNDSAYSLWRPFGKRHIYYASDNTDMVPLASKRSIRWWVVKEAEWLEHSDMPLTNWARANHMKIVGSFPIISRIEGGAETWYLLAFEDEADRHLPGLEIPATRHLEPTP